MPKEYEIAKAPKTYKKTKSVVIGWIALLVFGNV